MIRKLIEWLFWRYQEKDNWKMKMNEPIAIQKLTKEETQRILLINKLQKDYIEKVYAEMERRGLNDEEIERIIAKTGFMTAIKQYPEEQLHMDVSDAVDEIILTAARRE